MTSRFPRNPRPGHKVPHLVSNTDAIGRPCGIPWYIFPQSWTDEQCQEWCDSRLVPLPFNCYSVREQIKALPGSRWDHRRKCWLVRSDQYAKAEAIATDSLRG